MKIKQGMAVINMDNCNDAADVYVHTVYGECLESLNLDPTSALMLVQGYKSRGLVKTVNVTFAEECEFSSK